VNSGRTEQTGDLGVGTDSVSPPAATARYNPAVRQISLAGGPGVANAACSGTVNWTLNYTYTDLQPKTYTGTSSTSGTIGQTNNYTTPVGLGGQVVAKAQATLNGQQ